MYERSNFVLYTVPLSYSRQAATNATILPDYLHFPQRLGPHPRPCLGDLSDIVSTLVNRKDLTLIDESPSASRILTPQKPAPRSGLRQRHLDAFFCAPSSPATPVTAAAQKATVLPIRTPTQQPKGRSLRPQKPRIDLSDDSLSSILALSSGSAQSDVEHNIGSEDGSNFSSEGENDSSSDAISAASTSTTNTTENTTEDSDSIPRVAPKRNPAQRIRTVKAQSEEEAAAAMNGVAPDVRNVDSFTYKCGIDLSLPPLHRLEDIFDDMAEKAMKLDLENVVKHLQGRKLKVITVCSGTESPLLALGLIRESWSSQRRIRQDLADML